MNRRLFQFAIILLWLALPIVALEYRLVWDQLPVHVATHFNAAHQANGWMSREESLTFILRMLGIVLTVSTVILLAVSWRTVEAFTWALLGFFALAIGFLVTVNQALLNYNLHATPIDAERMIVVLAVAAVALLVIYLASHRHAPLPSGETLAVETHAGRGWGIAILVVMFAPLVAVSIATNADIRVPMMVIGTIGLGAIVMAWSGFQYRFLQHGVEVRMLGFRLRSIPRSAIVSYSVEPWAFIRGYGIRGIGSTRAYVWCNKVVHIKTTNGEVYLGHNDPERIVRDLDRVMSFVTQG